MRWLIVWALTTIYPILWVIMNSFKDKKHIMSDAFSLPVGELFTMSNYQDAFEKVDILSAYKNSILISGAVAVLVIFLAGMASFAPCKIPFSPQSYHVQPCDRNHDVPCIFNDHSGVSYGVRLGTCRFR